jgi:hypothetical protein
VSDARGFYYGVAPSQLWIDIRANGDVRFRVQQLGAVEQVVDLTPEAVDKVIARLQHLREIKP